MRRVAVLGALRTPIGRFLGALSGRSAVELATGVVSELCTRSEVSADTVDEFILGVGRQAGCGPNPARQVALRSGGTHTATAYTVNMACGSGMLSIIQGANSIASGMSEIVVAGGTESMSNLPYYLESARTGYRLGHGQLVDGMYRDGFHCPLADQLMGRTAENLAEEFEVPRSAQDEYAARSQQRCENARREGRFAAEIVAVEVPGKRGSTTTVTRDEHPRDGVTAESLSRLAPVFKDDGTVHPGNSSGITDGAAALLLTSEERCRELGRQPLALIGPSARAGVEPRRMGMGPVPATRTLLARTGRTLDDYELVELNEAFAAQVIACDRELRIDPDRLNVNGGAIALGHPIGATGARIVVTLLHEMQRRSAARGLATLCISGGLGLALELEASR